MVLNMVMHIAPCCHESPRWMSTAEAEPACQVAEQARIAAWTALGLLPALAWSAPAGSVTLTRPISFCLAVWEGTPTVDSAKAIVFDVPSITRAIDLDCWNANRPA